jgi:amidase
MTTIDQMDATALGAAIKLRQLSCEEVMRAHLARVARFNPTHNAIINLRPEDDLIAEARLRDRELAQGLWHGPLHGLPQAIKDLEPQRDMKMTMGSPLLKDFVPPEDSVMVERIRASGAIFIGRTNTPEFGLGSHTYNPVHGRTRNAYDPTRSAGGSSGGAAVALALRMLPVADGGDYMGSLRNPAGWNNIYSLRPCVGRIPGNAREVWLPTMSTLGPMGRSVRDVAMLFGIQHGADPRSPLSLDGRVDTSEAALERDVAGLRIGWLGDMGGWLPYEDGALDLCREALKTFERLGCTVEEALPAFDLERLWSSFLTIRAWQAGSGLLELYRDPKRRALIKPEAIFEIESGAKLSAYDVTIASAQRTSWYGAMRRLFERFDFLVLPSAQLFPFDVEINWPKEVGGRTMTTYHEWMKVVVPGTMGGCPIATVPAGFSEGGLPMGLQLMGPNHSELACLQLARAYEKATGWVEKRRPDAL